MVQREVVDLPSYVELWLKDAGIHGSPEYHERYDTWLSWFEQQGAEAVGFGWVNLRKTSPAAVRTQPPPGGVALRHRAAHRSGGRRRSSTGRPRCATSATRHCWRSRLVARADLRQETYGAPGAEDPEEIVLRQQLGMRRARQVDTVEAALVGACDGELTLAQILAALAQLLEQDEHELLRTSLPVVRELVVEGFLATERTD